MRQPAKWHGISLNKTLIPLKEKRNGRDRGHEIKAKDHRSGSDSTTVMFPALTEEKNHFSSLFMLICAPS